MPATRTLKFLIVKLSAIGDVIHALPVASFLKRAVPGCTVTWLVEKASADLVSNNPAIDEVIIFGGKKWMRELGKPGTWLKNFSEAEAFFKGLRDARYDAVLELQGLLKSSLLARATGSKVVAGFDDTREFADRFLTHKLNVGDYFGHDVPVVELNLRVAEFALTILGLKPQELPIEFPLPVLDSSVDVKISALLISPTPAAPEVASVPQMGAIPNLEAGRSAPINIVLIPGTTWVTKIWPEDKWIELGEKLADQNACRLILVGGPSEITSNYAIARGIESKRPQQVVLNLTGQTTLLDLISVFKRSSLVIGADTGPLHLAAATGLPRVVGVFGSTPGKRNGPYGSQCKTVHLNLECQPCYSKTCKYGTVACLTELAPAEVLKATV
ncbi:MAG TPA: glycosyltransferase family 9 protein [Drouetiella sp.]|jgi:lipopolysaccharide heptosyltransferase I